MRRYRAFHRFGQAKLDYGFRLEPIFNTASKMRLGSKVVEMGSKIIISPFLIIYDSVSQPYGLQVPKTS